MQACSLTRTSRNGFRSEPVAWQIRTCPSRWKYSHCAAVSSAAWEPIGASSLLLQLTRTAATGTSTRKGADLIHRAPSKLDAVRAPWPRCGRPCPIPSARCRAGHRRCPVEQAHEWSDGRREHEAVAEEVHAAL